MSQQHTTDTHDDPDLEWEPVEEEAPPPRRRRRRLTPVSGGLAAVVLATAGFIAGVQVQKGQSDDGGTTGGGGARAGFAARLGGAAPAGAGAAQGNASSGATVGTVANVKGSTLYVTGADGTTTKIRTNGDSKVTRNAESSARAVHPGDSVVVQGTENRSGSVTATSIAATAKGVAAFGGLSGLGGAPSGGASSSSGGTGGVPQGFAPPQG